jgi:hypothetical protein
MPLQQQKLFTFKRVTHEDLSLLYGWFQEPHVKEWLPVPEKDMVLINHLTASASLDFIDNLKILDHPVILVGETTSADRLYMEIKTVELPSKLAHLVYPIKVYRNRRRGDNEPYHPDIVSEGNLDDTQILSLLTPPLLEKHPTLQSK